MSLDCYPFGKKQSIKLDEQPLAIDVVSEDDLLICATNDCRSITIFDLRAEQSDQLVGEFPIGEDIVIDRIVYCKTGDYIACVGHKNGTVSIYTIFNWRQTTNDALQIMNLNYSGTNKPDDIDRRDKLSDIDSCQRTGNLAASYGDLIQIYRFVSGPEQTSGSNTDSVHSEAETVKDIDEDQTTNEQTDVVSKLQIDEVGSRFKHIISVKLSLWSSKVCLVENYLSVTTVDHVQVIKLELLTLQIQSDGQEQDQQLEAINISGSSSMQTSDPDKSPTNSDSNNLSPSNEQPSLGGQNVSGCGQSKVAVAATRSKHQNIQDETNSETATTTTTGTTLASCSVMSDSNSTTATNFSSFNTTIATNSPNGRTFNSQSEMSIITMPNNNQQSQDIGQDHLVAAAAATLNEDSNDDCITWNLNTKKLVKLPTLMHNTSNSLSSYHICHPLELLGPASESIACRVQAYVYSDDYCQNQLEPIVMLCKQFDFDRDPVKLAHLQAIYLANSEDQKRLSRSTGSCDSGNQAHDNDQVANNNNIAYNNPATMTSTTNCLGTGPTLLKSADYDLLTSVTYFVATLTNCFVYSMQGRKVTRIQTITHPDVCLDLRPSLLNVYLLTPLGLQICSTGSCDSTFRYDWSSSADLNLNFIACNKSRILTSDRFIVLISSSTTTTTTTTTAANPMYNDNQQRVNIPRHPKTTAKNTKTMGTGAKTESRSSCLIEFMEKPSLIELSNRIYHTTNRCNSISVRSNLLSYLHASAQLELFKVRGVQADTTTTTAVGGTTSDTNHSQYRDTIEVLRHVTMKLCEQLLLKKQTNVITNNKIDKAIKHLLDISFCDLSELMRRHLDNPTKSVGDGRNHLEASVEDDYDGNDKNTDASTQGSGDDNDEEDDLRPFDCYHELIKIYLKHAKCNSSMLEYLQTNSNNDLVAGKLINYMYEYNPRLLIRCAKRFTWSSPFETNNDARLSIREEKKYCVTILVDKLKLLAELDSTGINRATVLFTLAILYDSLGDLEQCLTSLAQIKPQNHLAITMCSNHEVSHSIAAVVNEHYPEVFSLFLHQLAKRDRDSARDYVRLYRSGELHGDSTTATTTTTSKAVVRPFGGGLSVKSDLNRAGEKVEQAYRGGEVDDDLDEEDLFEQKLKIVAEIPPTELIDLLMAGDSDVANCDRLEDREAIRAYLKASINLLESQFILSRLSESTQLTGGGGGGP